MKMTWMLWKIDNRLHNQMPILITSSTSSFESMLDSLYTVVSMGDNLANIRNGNSI